MGWEQVPKIYRLVLQVLEICLRESTLRVCCEEDPALPEVPPVFPDGLFPVLLLEPPLEEDEEDVVPVISTLCPT